MERELETKYLPCSEQQLRDCLATASKGGGHANDSEDIKPRRIGVEYYKKSIEKYAESKENPEQFRPIAKAKLPRQIEKEERFWTAATLMAFRYSNSPRENWSKLLNRCFGAQRPPVGDFVSWDDAVGENPALLLEAPMPSPRAYSYWLRDHLPDQQIIPYVFDAVPTNREAKLEGFTH